MHIRRALLKQASGNHHHTSRQHLTAENGLLWVPTWYHRPTLSGIFPVLFPNEVRSRYAFRPAVYGQSPCLLHFTPIHSLVLIALPGFYACWSLLFFFLVLFSKSFFLQVKSQITRFFIGFRLRASSPRA